MRFGVSCRAGHAVGVLLVAALLAAAALFGSTAAGASSPQTEAVRAVYRKVLTAEYFGPARAVCSRLTARGKRSFAAASGASSCRAAFKAQQHILKHKNPHIDNSGYTPSGWRQVVNSVMAHLKVSIHGSHASAIGGKSGIPGKTTLVKIGGRWLFNSYPPSIQP
jgi:hypothetical protein